MVAGPDDDFYIQPRGERKAEHKTATPGRDDELLILGVFGYLLPVSLQVGAGRGAAKSVPHKRVDQQQGSCEHK